MNREDFLKLEPLKAGRKILEDSETWVFGDGEDTPFDGSWKDHVTLQQQSGPDATVFYLKVFKRVVEAGTYGTGLDVSITSDRVADGEFIYTDDTIETAILETLNSFPEVSVSNMFDFNKYSVGVAKKTRRGRPNYNIGNTWYYAGHSEFDVPFIVLSKEVSGENSYAIWKQDNFEDYGFVMV